MKRNIEAETPHWSMKQRADIKKNRSNFGCFDKNRITSVTMNYDLGMLKKKRSISESNARHAFLLPHQAGEERVTNS